MTTKVKPLRNELRPRNPIQPWTQPADTYRYKVKGTDTWVTLGARNNIQWGEHHLIWINFKLTPLDYRWTDQVNWYLREYVGCRHSDDGGKNWAFAGADPGYIFLPDINYVFDPLIITGTRGTGGLIGAPEYSDDNALDTISKALDIFGAVDTGLAISGITMPAIASAGFIVTGALAGIVGPIMSVAGPHADALKKVSREHFFGGFCRTLVMTADSWSDEMVAKFYPPMQLPPINHVYKEKRETFRKLYNFGLKAGVVQAKRMNTVDIRNLFKLLRKSLSAREQEEYSGTAEQIQAWSDEKKRDYYDRLSSILREIILKKNLQVKLR
jgi:hypothetical protein